MRLPIVLLTLLFTSICQAEVNFNTIELGLSQLDTSQDDLDFDGDGFAFSLSVELPNQFVLFGGIGNSEFQTETAEGKYDIDQDLRIIGIGRYANLSQESKLYFYFGTADVDQTNTLTRTGSRRQQSIPVDITRGQRIGVSYIYDTPLPIDITTTVQYEDFGTYEETGYGIAGYYNVADQFNVGVGYYSVDAGDQLTASFNFEYR